MRTAPLDQPMDSASSTATSMKAIVQKVYGSSPEDVLTFAESAIPVPAGDEVLVRVAAASVDRGTWHVMAGLPYPMRAAGFGISKPKTLNPGRCFAGTVESVGKDATGFNPGDLVYGTCQGSFAQFVAAKTSKLAPMPGTLSFVQAATVPISGVTALQAIRDKARAGRR